MLILNCFRLGVEAIHILGYPPSPIQDTMFQIGLPPGLAFLYPRKYI
jgi:hypothetical protein